MKTICYLAKAIVLVAFAAGCTRVEEQDTLEGREITITASFADNQTKTTLLGSGKEVYWEAGDEIKLFYDGTGSRFASQCTEPSRTSKFSGSLNVMFGFDEGFSDITPLLGLYPYRADATADNSSVTTTLPSEQTGKAGSFAKGMNISLAKSTSLSMGFYNVCGGVRFSVTRADVTDVVFEALGGESVAGKVKLGFNDGVPIVQEVVEGEDAIKLTAPGGGVFETGKWYYIVVLPGTLSGGFKMTFNTETKYAVLKSTDSRTVKRGVFGSLADADEDLVYKDKGTPEPGEDNIVFKDNTAKVACVEKYDTDSDGEVSYVEAAAVTSIAGLFADYNTVTSFDELKYFTKITDLGSALKGLTALKSVIVPAGVTSIENNAFDGCFALETVSFAGDAVKSIGNYAFRSCAALKDFVVPSGVKSIGNDAFRSCAALKDFVVPSGVTSISKKCFENCSSLESVDFPSGLTGIGAYSFSGCTKLGVIDFPSSLNTIGDYAFENCKAIKIANVPNSVKSFGSNVFNGCYFLETASLPSGLTSIPSGTFSGCISLCHLTFPDALATIGDDAFRYCSFFDKSTGVAKVELPSTVTTIGSCAFSNALNVLISSGSFVSIQSNTFSVGTRIFVPDAKVEAYKIRTNWSNYADHILALSSYTDTPAIEAVDLGLSVKWASCNVGSYFPEEYGRYFAWGDVVGQTWNGSSWSGYGFSISPDYELDSNNNLKPEYDAAHVNLGGNWRMPTKAECQELIDNCTSTWTYDYKGTGVAGRIFTSKKEGYTDKSIFLPAAGYSTESTLSSAGSTGNYWSSTFDRGIRAWLLYFNSDGVSSFNNPRNYGRSVRPVSE